MLQQEYYDVHTAHETGDVQRSETRLFINIKTITVINIDTILIRYFRSVESTIVDQTAIYIK
jgi:hypothetical protein